MAIQGAQTGVTCGTSLVNCPDKFGCPPNMCPDFTIRRHDTMPPFKVSVEDCDGPLDLTDLVLEASMWAKAKLKKAIAADDTFFSLADNIGFEQMMVGDIIIFDQTRLTERMLVTGFDEINDFVRVTRGYQATTASAWKKGAPFRIMRMLDSPAATQMVLDDIIEVDGTTSEDQLVESFLVYEWTSNDTCLPGCYWLEFKLLKMLEDVMTSSVGIMSTSDPSIIPTFTDPSLTPADFGCKLGTGVEWVRRYPVKGEGFLIKIEDSPTQEL